MADDTLRYERRVVVAVPGGEARTIATWRADGWELVDEQPGRVRVRLTFRRPTPRTARDHLAAARSGFRRLHPAARAGVAATGAVVLAAALAGVVLPRSGGAGEGAAAIGTPTAASAAPRTIAPTSTPASAPSVTATPAATILTRRNSPDLAALVAVDDPGDGLVARFASEYAGRTIAFNGDVTAVANTDDPARNACDADVVAGCDFLFTAGDSRKDRATGPEVKLDGVDSLRGLHLQGTEPPTTVRRGDAVRIVATVVRYDAETQLLHLAPVSTRVR